MRKNTGEIRKIWRDKNVRKKHLKEENCQEDSWQENYLDGWTKDTIKNTREDWKGTGDSGKGDNQEKER